jgi:molecular chaperone DnaK
LRKGGIGESLRIPVVEGNEPVADHNKFQGYLVIDATRIRRDLPVNSEVEITISIDESRTLRVEAYVPMLDEVFDIYIQPEKSTRSAAELRSELEQERDRLKQLNGKHQEEHGTRIGEVSDGKTIELMQLISAADADEGQARNAENKLLELRKELDEMAERLNWPATVRSARESAEELIRLADEHGNGTQRGAAQVLVKEADALVRDERREALARKVEEIHDLTREILVALPSFWVSVFKHIVSEKAKLSDKQLGERLIQQGLQSIEQGDTNGLRNVIGQLYRLLPEEVADSIQGRTRAYGSDVL